MPLLLAVDIIKTLPPFELFSALFLRFLVLASLEVVIAAALVELERAEEGKGERAALLAELARLIKLASAGNNIILTRYYASITNVVARYSLKLTSTY